MNSSTFSSRDAPARVQPWVTTVSSPEDSLLVSTPAGTDLGLVHCNFSQSWSSDDFITPITPPQIPELPFLDAWTHPPIKTEADGRSMSVGSAPSEEDIKAGRRRAQNRLAQRTYRARKENAIKEHALKSAALEQEVKSLKESNAQLTFNVRCLKEQVAELQGSVQWWRQLAHETPLSNSTTSTETSPTEND